MDVTKTGNEERGTGNGERGTGNGERETGNGKRETGNGKRETGDWETGNVCTAVTRSQKMADIGKEKGTIWGNVKKVNREFLRAVPPDDQLYVLVGAKSDWHWKNQAWEKITYCLNRSVQCIMLTTDLDCRLQTRYKTQA